MSLDIVLAMAVFASVLTFTPGPNNIMLTASGANFGFARTVPHMVGVTIGYMVLLAACAAGLGLAVAAVPAAQTALKVVSAAYMLWLAWRVANAAPADETGPRRAQPLTFWQAAAFQWVNPKGLMAALSAVAIFLPPGRGIGSAAVLVAIFGVTTVLSTFAWTGFGAALRGLLADPRRARIFNWTMAGLLAASIVPMVL